MAAKTLPESGVLIARTPPRFKVRFMVCKVAPGSGRELHPVPERYRVERVRAKIRLLQNSSLDLYPFLPSETCRVIARLNAVSLPAALTRKIQKEAGCRAHIENGTVARRVFVEKVKIAFEGENLGLFVAIGVDKTKAFSHAGIVELSKAAEYWLGWAKQKGAGRTCTGKSYIPGAYLLASCSRRKLCKSHWLLALSRFRVGSLLLLNSLSGAGIQLCEAKCQWAPRVADQAFSFGVA